MTPSRNTAAASHPKRADARRNADKVLRSAIRCLGERPTASINEIAAAAGVGRVTLYSHYGSREALVEAALEQALRDGETRLAAVDLTDPAAGLEPLIAASWQLTAQAGGLLAAARGVLSDERIREIHAHAETRVIDLIDRGQQDGAFRSDLPTRWLASVLHHVMKGAAADVAAGRIAKDDAPRLIHEVVLGAFQPTQIRQQIP